MINEDLKTVELRRIGENKEIRERYLNHKDKYPYRLELCLDKEQIDLDFELGEYLQVKEDKGEVFVSVDGDELRSSLTDVWSVYFQSKEILKEVFLDSPLANCSFHEWDRNRLFSNQDIIDKYVNTISRGR